AADVAQVGRVQRLGVELREHVQRLLVPPGREILPRLELPGIALGAGPGRAQRQRNDGNPGAQAAPQATARSHGLREYRVSREIWVTAFAAAEFDASEVPVA